MHDLSSTIAHKQKSGKINNAYKSTPQTPATYKSDKLENPTWIIHQILT